MSARDDQMMAANWARMREAINRAARELRRTADELEAIDFDSTAGIRRSPDAIISQAILSIDRGRTVSDLIHRLATWAETINEIPQQQRCGYRIEDPDTVCVLEPGHSLPMDDGLPVHVSGDGVMFA